jgi:hypothetical protein
MAMEAWVRFCSRVTSKIETDEKHVEHYADLRDHRKIRRDVRGRDLKSKVRSQPTKKGWSKKNPGDHLSPNPWLMHLAKDTAKNARHHKNDNKREQNMKQDAWRFGSRGPDRSLRSGCCGGYERVAEIPNQKENTDTCSEAGGVDQCAA